MKRDTLITPVLTFDGETALQRQDMLAVEEPLEIRIGGVSVSITMRTPGHDTDLAAGFLLTEGIVENIADILSLTEADNAVLAEIKPNLLSDPASNPERYRRNFYSTSSCGICGKASIAALETLPRRSMSSGPHIPAAIIHSLPDLLRPAQPVFDRTGGLHAAALFSPDGRLLTLREDVGRHNALDKLIGHALRTSPGLLNDAVILVSGRAGFELVQKCVMAGIPVLAAVGAPSSLAVETARRFGMTLAGFVRGNKFNIYSGQERIL